MAKLVWAEAESEALVSFLGAWPHRVSSLLTRVEVLRAVRRQGFPPSVRRRAVRVLSRIALVNVDGAVLEAATRLLPRELRSLDAIHLATARSIAPLAGIVTYDLRLAAAAERARLEVWGPA